MKRKNILRTLSSLKNIKNIPRTNSTEIKIYNSGFFKPLLDKKINSENNISIILKSQQMNANYVKIILKSNWGNSEKLSISSIGLFNENNQRIPLIYSSFIPNSIKIPSLNILTDGNLIQNEPGNSWKIDWPLPFEVSLIFLFSSEFQVKFIRIWNDKFEPDNGIKLVEIYDSEGKSCKGEIGFGFGGDLYLHEKIEQISTNNVFKDLLPENFNFFKFNDNFGNLPLPFISFIKFELLSNYSKDNNIGFYAIRIFNSNGDSINFNHIESFYVTNSLMKTNPSILFDSEEELIKNNSQNYFLLNNVTWDNFPEINIKLKKSIQITKIEIWNLNSLQIPLNYSLKSMKIYLDSRLNWIGNIKKCKNIEKNIFKSITEIWFTDDPKLRISMSNITLKG